MCDLKSDKFDLEPSVRFCVTLPLIIRSSRYVECGVFSIYTKIIIVPLQFHVSGTPPKEKGEMRMLIDSERGLRDMSALKTPSALKCQNKT